MAFVLASRLVYTQSIYPLCIIVFDAVLVFVNILAVLVSVLYVTKLELYAGLPRNLPSPLPPYDLNVSFELLFFRQKWHLRYPGQNHLPFTFQDMSTDVENVCQEESLEEEKVNQNKEVKSFEEKNTVKTFSPFFPQDISADIAKLCDEEIQTVEGEEVTYL